MSLLTHVKTADLLISANVTDVLIGGRARDACIAELQRRFPDTSTDGDGIPLIVMARYYCDCGTSWQDNWSCACDDECPKCGTSIAADDWDIEQQAVVGQDTQKNTRSR